MPEDPKSEKTVSFGGQAERVGYEPVAYHRDEGQVRGWRNVHVTDGDHPYMKHWWVPGLQIGYEHTFVHQFADFVNAVAEGSSLTPPQTSSLNWHTLACVEGLVRLSLSSDSQFGGRAG